MVIDGILFRTRAGCPWRDLPGEYGNWKTAYNRHRRWPGDGTREKILARLRAGCDQGEARRGARGPAPAGGPGLRHRRGRRAAHVAVPAAHGWSAPVLEDQGLLGYTAQVGSAGAEGHGRAWHVRHGHADLAARQRQRRRPQVPSRIAEHGEARGVEPG